MVAGTIDGEATVATWTNDGHDRRSVSVGTGDARAIAATPSGDLVVAAEASPYADPPTGYVARLPPP